MSYHEDAGRAGQSGMRAGGALAALAPPADLPLWLLGLIVGALALCLALLPLPVLVSLVGIALAVGLALADPVFGLYWVVLSVPVQQAAVLPGGITFTQAAVLLAVGAWMLRVLAHPERRIVKGRLLPLWATLLWALLISTSFTPYSRSEGLRETARWAVAFLTWLIAVNTLRRRWHLIGLVVCLLLAPAAEAMIGIAQFLTGDGPPSFRVGAGFVRAYGTIGTPNAFAGYLNMAWPLAVAVAIGAAAALRRHPLPAAPWNRRMVASQWLLTAGLGSLAGLLLFALVASFSRGGWLGAAAGVVGLTLALGRRASRLVWGALAVGALVIALGGAGLLPDALEARLASMTRNLTLADPGTVTVTPENFAVVERTAQLWAGWRMLVQHPLTGVGPGNYTLAYQDVAVAPWYASRGHAHNYYLHIAAEAGAIGALAYLALLAGVVAQAVAALRRARGIAWRSVTVGSCGIIAAVAGHNLFENVHVLNMGIQLSAAWALLEIIGTRQPAPAAGGQAEHERLIEGT